MTCKNTKKEGPKKKKYFSKEEEEEEKNRIEAYFAAAFSYKEIVIASCVPA